MYLTSLSTPSPELREFNELKKGQKVKQVNLLSPVHLDLLDP
jgi:hypothetical protein